MPSLVRRVARRYLPHRVRAAGLELLGKNDKHRRRAGRPAPKGGAPKRVKPTRRRKQVAPPVPAPTVSAVVQVLRRGGSLPEAVVAEIRTLIDGRHRGPANAVAAALRSDPETADLGRLITGIIAAADAYDALAWSELRQLPEPLWTTHAAREFARSGMRTDPAGTLRRIADLAERAPDFVPTSAWLALLEPVFGHGDHDLVRRLFAIFDAQVGNGSAVAESLVVNRDWLRPWVAANPDGASAPAVPEGSVSFAIMDYGHPGRSRASANIGDHVQSLASLGHLARHQGIDYEGPQDLVDLMTQLRSRARPELQRTAVNARVQLLQIDRDASMYSAIPPDTWTLAFGWYMHAIFDTRYGLPFHPNLLPIFVSFHCSKRDLLTDEAVSYLRRFAPIGCRDWTTVDILLSVGVPSFFSGCLTTTVRTVFPDQLVPTDPDAPVAYVDMPTAAVPTRAPVYAHSSDAIRFRSFAANVYDAIELLETYRGRHSGLVTSRLHCYLPVRSLGVPVDFQPKNRSDPRFAGLIDITDAEFTAIQSTIESRLERVIEAIADHRTPQEVYGLWRELNDSDVALAERRRHADHQLPAVRTELISQVTRLRAQSDGMDPDAIAVVVPVRTDGAEAATVLISSAAEHTSRSLQFVLLTRDPGSLDLSALERAAAGHRVQVIDTRGIGDDLRAAGRKLSPADLDRLVIADLLPNLDLAIVLPTDAMVLADLAELAATDLGGHLLASCDLAGRTHASGFGVLNAAANRLRNATAASAEFRRLAYARHRFDFDAFDTDLLLMDLAAWRDGAVTGGHLPYIEEFGLDYREVLHLVVGPDRAVLADRWHAVPGRCVMDDAAVIHWSEATKPWSSDIAPDRERWHAARDRLNAAR